MLWPSTRLDIDSFLDDLEDAEDRNERARLAFVETGRLTVTTGDWCTYCHSMAWCPEKTRLARAMVADLSDLEQRIAELPAELAGAAWRKADQAHGILKRIYAALEERAHLEWLPTEPGKVVRPIQYEQESFSRDGALVLLRELGATDEQIGTLYRTILIDSVRETKDPNAPKALRRPRKVKAA